MMNSPLGKYAQIVAAIVAVGVIAAYVIGILAKIDVSEIRDITLIAIGAVFSSAGIINGTKRDLAAIQTRLDKASIPPAKNNP